MYRIVSEAPLPFGGAETISSPARCSTYMAYGLTAGRHLVLRSRVAAKLAVEFAGIDLQMPGAEQSGTVETRLQFCAEFVPGGHVLSPSAVVLQASVSDTSGASACDTSVRHVPAPAIHCEGGRIDHLEVIRMPPS
jgi:hypothetical protein